MGPCPPPPPTPLGILLLRIADILSCCTLNGALNSKAMMTYFSILFQVIARLVDGSAFHEFKQLFGPTLITGFAHVDGWVLLMPFPSDSLMFCLLFMRVHSTCPFGDGENPKPMCYRNTHANKLLTVEQVWRAKLGFMCYGPCTYYRGKENKSKIIIIIN